MLYTERWAFAPVGSAGKPELYDNRTDPTATKNVASRRPKVVAESKAMLIDWLVEIDAPPETVDLLR